VVDDDDDDDVVVVVVTAEEDMLVSDRCGWDAVNRSGGGRSTGDMRSSVVERSEGGT